MTETKQNKVYVVTRNSRRIEDKNYPSKAEAQIRAEQLIAMLKQWKDPDQKRVKIVETSNPSKIR
jgi:hypothetical protein